MYFYIQILFYKINIIILQDSLFYAKVILFFMSFIITKHLFHLLLQNHFLNCMFKNHLT